MRFRVLCASALFLMGCGKTHKAQADQDSTRARRDTSNTAALDSASVTPAEITLGDSVFNGQPRGGMCATCHGPGGAGTSAAPNLRDGQWINGDGSLGFIEGTIVQGVPNPTQHPFPMPPFGGTLTDRQLHAVAAYVYALSHPQKGIPESRRRKWGRGVVVSGNSRTHLVCQVFDVITRQGKDSGLL